MKISPIERPLTKAREGMAEEVLVRVIGMVPYGHVDTNT